MWVKCGTYCRSVQEKEKLLGSRIVNWVTNSKAKWCCLGKDEGSIDLELEKVDRSMC